MSHKDAIPGKLIITGKNPVPVQITAGIVTSRLDITGTHEQEDTVIIHHMLKADAPEVLVVADDTDIFVLLCHFVHTSAMHGQIRMISPIKGRTMIDINKSVERNASVMGNLFAVHGISGRDTVCTYYGIGKSSVLKVLRNNIVNLEKAGTSCTNKPLSDVTEQATKFLLLCYGHPEYKTMTEARQKIWSSKVTGALKLQTLPPTTQQKH